MKKIFIVLIFFFLAHGCVEANIFTEEKVGDITLRYVTYPVNSDIYKLHVVTSETATNIDTLALSKNALTGINGVFFCPADYRECGGRNFTINERFVEGVDTSHYEDSGERGVFGWDENGKPFIYQTGRLNPDKRGDIYEGMGNFPILFFEGRNMLEHYHDVGLYDRKMSASLPRHFICSNRDGSLIHFGSSSATSLDSLAPALYTIGCHNALNLDAGGSTQYLYNGRRLATASRNILDGFVIAHREIQTSKIEEEMRIVTGLLELRLRRGGDRQKSSQRRDMIVRTISELRNEIYRKYSVDMYNEQGVYLGYRLEVTDKPELERVYRINMLEKKLRAMNF